MGCFSKPDKPNYVSPTYTKLTLPELQTAFDKFLGQEGNFQALQDLLYTSASKKLDSLEKIQPGYRAGLTQAQQIADSYASGNLPSDVANKISRSAAFKGLMSGLQGPQRETVEARDLGLTSADLQTRGLVMQQALRQEANAQMPLQAVNLAFTPQAIRQEDVSLAEYNNKITNMQADANANTHNRQEDANFAYDSQYGGSPFSAIFGGGAGALAGGLLGNLVAPGVGAVVGAGLGMSLGSGIGGAFGGGQGRTMASVLGGGGGMLANTAGMFFQPNLGAGSFSSVGQAMMAAPYAASYTPYQGGFVPRAEPVSAANPYLTNFRASKSNVVPRGP